MPESLIREALRGRLTDPGKLGNFNWLMRMVDTPSILPLFGYMTHAAVEHQEWTFWEVLAEARKKFQKLAIS